MAIEGNVGISGGDTYYLPDIDVSSNDVLLYDKISGIGGIGYVPSDGDEVVVTTGDITTDGADILQPSLNNKIYYLVSDVVYGAEDKETILSLATEIPVTLVSNKYQGTFTYSNPNDLPYLYIIWDYTDSISSSVVSYSGNATTRYLDVNLSDGIGRAGVNVETTSKPSRYVLKYNDNTVGQ